MKKNLSFLLFLIAGNIYCQKSSEILPVLNVDALISPPNFVFVQPGNNYWQKTDVSHLILPINQISNLQTSLDTKYTTPTGSITQYIRGDGTLSTFPAIPASQANSDWSSVSGVSQILNKPTIPTDNNQLINGSGYITATSTNTLTNKSGNISQWTNNSGYLTSIPAQSFSSLTGKPTTISGYGITDAYPLTGNPSSFLTGITSGQVTLALGYTPITDSRTINGVALTSNISLTKSDIGLGNIDNISDLNKPISTATQTALNTKQNTLVSGTNIKTLNGNTLLGSGDLIINNNYTAGSGINITSNIITNLSPDQTVTLTAGNRMSITGTYPNFTIGYVEPTINTPVVRTLNSNFTISTTKQAMVSYSVTCSVTNPLLIGTSSAMSYLEYSTNAGSTWLLPAQNGNSSGVGITVTLQLTNGQTGTLVGIIPANALVRLRTATTGTASVTYITGTEIY